VVSSLEPGAFGSERRPLARGLLPQAKDTRALLGKPDEQWLKGGG